MEIKRYLLNEETKTQSNIEHYNLDPNYRGECICGAEDEYDECQCEGIEGLGCADYFTCYTSRSDNFNRLKINSNKVQSIKKDLPKLYYILNKLNVEYESDCVIKGTKRNLVFIFRIIRLCAEPYRFKLDFIYNNIKTKKLGVFQSIIISDIQEVRLLSHRKEFTTPCIYNFHLYTGKSNEVKDNIFRYKAMYKRRLEVTYYININLDFSIIEDEKVYVNKYKNQFLYVSFSNYDVLYDKINISIKNVKSEKDIDKIFDKIETLFKNFNDNFEKSENQVLLHNKLIENLKKL